LGSGFGACPLSSQLLGSDCSDSTSLTSSPTCSEVGLDCGISSTERREGALGGGRAEKEARPCQCILPA